MRQAVLTGGEPAPARVGAAALADILRHAAATNAHGTITYLKDETESRVTYAALLGTGRVRALHPGAVGTGARDSVILQFDPNEFVRRSSGDAFSRVSHRSSRRWRFRTKGGGAEDIVQIGERLEVGQCWLMPPISRS